MNPFDDRDPHPEPPDPWCDRCGDTGIAPLGGPCPKCGDDWEQPNNTTKETR